MVKHFVVKASVLSRKGAEKRDNLVTLSPGLLYSLINDKEAQGMGLVNQDQRLTRSQLVSFF